MIALGREGLSLHDVILSMHTMQTSFKNSLKPRPFPSVDRQRFILMDNALFHKSCEVQKAFEDARHIYLCLPSYKPFPYATKWIFGHIKSHVQWNDLQNHGTLLGHINHHVQAINTNMVQGWIREVNQNFDRANYGKRLGESYT